MSENGATNDGHYSMILEWEPEGGAYVVTVPELSGCRTHGETLEEAVKHAREVIDLWIDAARERGDAVPPPRFFRSCPADASESAAARAGNGRRTDTLSGDPVPT